MMQLDDLIERVNQLEQDDADYKRHADRMEAAWALRDDPLNRTMEEARNADGQEHITLPTPYNVTILAERMFSNLPRIKVPSSKGQEDDDKKARLRARFLTALWQRLEREYSSPILGGGAWQSIVLGRHAFGVRWIYDELPDVLKSRRLPLIVQTYDPRTVYAEEDWRGLTFVSRKYQERWTSVYAFYKEYGILKPPDAKAMDDWIDMTECFWMEYDGYIWHAVYAKTPVRDGRGEKTGKYDSQFAKP